MTIQCPADPRGFQRFHGIPCLVLVATEIDRTELPDCAEVVATNQNMNMLTKLSTLAYAELLPMFHLSTILKFIEPCKVCTN